MDKLFEVIDNRINKILSARRNIQIKPATVKEVTDFHVVVKPIGINTNITLPNYTGGFVEVGDEVKIAYTGQAPQENNAYIIGTPHSWKVIPVSDYDEDNAREGTLYFCYDDKDKTD